MWSNEIMLNAISDLRQRPSKREGKPLQTTKPRVVIAFQLHDNPLDPNRPIFRVHEVWNCDALTVVKGESLTRSDVSPPT